jgi:branched-chain amino acid transport system permease protein
LRPKALPTALLALPLGIAITALFMLGTDRVVYRYYREKKVDPIIVVMASLGVMFIMNGVVRLIIGPDDQNFADGARFLMDGHWDYRRIDKGSVVEYINVCLLGVNVLFAVDFITDTYQKRPNPCPKSDKNK